MDATKRIVAAQLQSWFVLLLVNCVYRDSMWEDRPKHSTYPHVAVYQSPFDGGRRQYYLHCFTVDDKNIEEAEKNTRRDLLSFMYIRQTADPLSIKVTWHCFEEQLCDVHCYKLFPTYLWQVDWAWEQKSEGARPSAALQVEYVMTSDIICMEM